MRSGDLVIDLLINEVRAVQILLTNGFSAILGITGGVGALTVIRLSACDVFIEPAPASELSMSRG